MRAMKYSFIAIFFLLIALPVNAGAEGTAQSFSQAPVQYMSGIYKDYHDWRIDEAITKATAALGSVNSLYAKDHNSVINDRNLRLNKAFQVKSTLHTLLGMLYYRKSLTVITDRGSQAFDDFAEKREITEEELARLVETLKKEDSLSEIRGYLEKSRQELEEAVSVDSANPSPHFQLASLYSSMKTTEGMAKAEEEYYQAAKLSGREGDGRSAERAIEALRDINPRSPWLERWQKGEGGKNYAQ